MGDKPYAIRHGLTRSPPRRPRRPWPRTRDTVSASPGRRENTTPPRGPCSDAVTPCAKNCCSFLAPRGAPSRAEGPCPSCLARAPVPRRTFLSPLAEGGPAQPERVFGAGPGKPRAALLPRTAVPGCSARGLGRGVGAVGLTGSGQRWTENEGILTPRPTGAGAPASLAGVPGPWTSIHTQPEPAGFGCCHPPAPQAASPAHAGPWRDKSDPVPRGSLFPLRERPPPSSLSGHVLRELVTPREAASSPSPRGSRSLASGAGLHAAARAPAPKTKKLLPLQ